MLSDRIKNKDTGVIFYGITPPKENLAPERIAEIAAKHKERIGALDIDGLVLYDIQDESARISVERPFPFLPTLEPQDYSKAYLGDLDLPKINFQCVGNHSKESLISWMKGNVRDGNCAVFVGNSSADIVVDVTMDVAFELRNEEVPDLLVGGIAIPERHYQLKNEHLRMQGKVDQGASFFTTQAVYNVEASKNMLSEYYYQCKQNGKDMVPIMFTLSPCGSVKTMEFMKWLGINIPQWLKNDLKHSNDILNTSVETCVRTFKELLKFSLNKGIPIGCNIESVSIRKDEIEASMQMLEQIQELFASYIKAEV